MSKFYQDLDRAGGFDYQLHQLPTLGWRRFRGPPVDTSKPYLAFVGAAQTFGRFCTRPFPSLLGQRLNLPVLNLGVGGSGPRHFRNGAYLDLINGAEAVVLQVLSSRSASNSLFDNSLSGGLEGRLTKDGSTVHSEEFFRNLAETASREEFEKIVEETRNDYMQTFSDLLRQITVPKALFWFSVRPPAHDDDYSDLPLSLFQATPQLVNERMTQELAAYADAYAECVSTSGLPQTLWSNEQSINGATARNGVLENNYYPSPEMHSHAADALENTCRILSGRYDSAAENDEMHRFVIIAAERTGTNLLIGMLRDYADCQCGYELFNPVNIEEEIIPWVNIPGDRHADLCDLRSSDPVAFWRMLCVESEASGFRAAGFKLLYGHGIEQEMLLEALTADETLLVIHVTRRNLLRRAISEEQAKASGRWAERWSSPATRRAPVALTASDIIQDIDQIEQHQALYEHAFASHRVLRIFYEDLAKRPLRVAERTAAFLGLKAREQPARVKWRKTGSEKLSEALRNADALRAQLRQWASFFD